MVSEMTGDYSLLLPTMWVSTLCFLLCKPWTLYEKQVPSPLESPAHRGEFILFPPDGNLIEGVEAKRLDQVGETHHMIEVGVREKHVDPVGRQQQPREGDVVELTQIGEFVVGRHAPASRPRARVGHEARGELHAGAQRGDGSHLGKEVGRVEAFRVIEQGDRGCRVAFGERLAQKLDAQDEGRPQRGRRASDRGVYPRFTRAVLAAPFTSEMAPVSVIRTPLLVTPVIETSAGTTSLMLTLVASSASTLLKIKV